jgi:post-segregation antitoxin (ccd killing protein)
MQVYLPDDLYELVKARSLPASELLQKAVRAELRRLDLLAQTDRYVAELVAEVGPPAADQRARRCRGATHRATVHPPGRLTVVLVLDSGGVTRLAERSRQAAALIHIKNASTRCWGGTAERGQLRPHGPHLHPTLVW